MKLKEAIESVDRSTDNQDRLGGKFFTAMGFPSGEYHENSDAVEALVQSYWLVRRNCTDEWVGARVYFFNDKAFAVSTQPSRKCGEDFKFVSRELFVTVYEALSTILVEHPSECDLLELDTEIGDTYNIEYYNGVIDLDVFYLDEPATILRDETREKRSKLSGTDHYIYKNAVIRTAAGEVKEVALSELSFPFRLAK